MPGYLKGTDTKMKSIEAQSSIVKLYDAMIENGATKEEIKTLEDFVQKYLIGY